MPRPISSILLLLAMSTLSIAAEVPDRHVLLVTIDGLPAYLLDDPQASLPVIEGLRSKGVYAAGGMRVTNPSVTWPNHTTLVTGVHPDAHGVLFNGLLERGGVGKPVRVVPDKLQHELVQGPLLFDLFKSAGLSTAAINWPCTKGSTSIDDNFPDAPGSIKAMTPRLKQALEARDLITRFQRGGGPIHDEVWAEAARDVILSQKPKFMALHFLNLDSTHHRYGPKSAPGYTAASLIDAQLGRVVSAFDEAGIRDKTTIIVTADHGFITVKKTIRPNVILRREGFIDNKSEDITRARAFAVSEGGIAMVFLTDPDTVEQDRQTIHRLFENIEGISAIVDPADYAKFHFPQPSQNQGMAEVVLAAKEGYSFTASVIEDEPIGVQQNLTGSHGYLSTEPLMNAIFVASGAGIKPGAKLDSLDNVDVAPTIGKLLGVSVERAAGRVLAEILDESH